MQFFRTVMPPHAVYDEWLARLNPRPALARAMAAFGLERLLLSSGTEKLSFHPEAWHLAAGAMEQLKLMRAAALGGLLAIFQKNNRQAKT